MKNLLKFSLAAGLMVALLAASTAEAQIINSVLGPDEATVVSSFGAGASSTDLANGLSFITNLPSGNSGLPAGDPLLLMGAGNFGDITNGVFGTGFGLNASNGPAPLRIQLSLPSSELIGGINIFTGGTPTVRGGQDFEIFGSNAATVPGLDETDALNGYTLIADVQTLDDAGNQLIDGFGATSITGIDTTFQHFLIVSSPVTGAGGGEGTIFKEVDIFAAADLAVPEPCSVVLIGLGSVGMFIRRRRS